MPRPLRVFLCHASQDKPIVRELYQRLKAEDWIDPWLDKAKLLPGQDWELVIEKAVDDSDVVIVCLSSQSVSKEGFVQREIRYAYDLALEKPEDTIFLIPLRLDDCAMPRKLRSFHWVDYFGKEKKNAYSDLLQAMKLRYDQKLKMEEPQDQEEPKAEVLEKQPEVRFTQRKPYTKILDPSSLNPTPVRKTRSQPDYLRYGIAGILLLLFIMGGLGLNSLITKPPEATSLSTSQDITETPKPPTGTLPPSMPTLANTPTPSPTPTLGIGSTMISEKDGMVLVFIPEGEFTMGSDRYPNEQPVHQIFLDSFWIDQTEVTNAMYAKCVEDGGCSPPATTRSFSRDSYYGSPEFGNYPVIYVDWNQADAYCSWAGGELPTEAQWEKAARGKNGLTYPWGENIDCNWANYKTSCNGDTIKARNYTNAASVYGVYDLSGNVWEWTSSLHKSYPYNSLDGREDMSSTDDRVIRGGAWNDWWYTALSTYRKSTPYANGAFNIGFRCALLP